MLETVPTPPLHPERFREVLTAERAEEFERVLIEAGKAFAGRVVWNVNSTAREIILARLGNRGKGAPTIDAASVNFDRLSASTAQRVVRFWQITPGNLSAT